MDLNGFANGALKERFEEEMQKILENLADPNTDPKKARKLTVSVTVKGDETRDLAFASVQAKSSLAPARDIQTKILIDRNNAGRVVGNELKSGAKGQMFIDNDGELSDDTGNKLPAEGERKIINLQQSK